MTIKLSKPFGDSFPNISNRLINSIINSCNFEVEENERSNENFDEATDLKLSKYNP